MLQNRADPQLRHRHLRHRVLRIECEQLAHQAWEHILQFRRLCLEALFVQCAISLRSGEYTSALAPLQIGSMWVLVCWLRAVYRWNRSGRIATLLLEEMSQVVEQ